MKVLGNRLLLEPIQPAAGRFVIPDKFRRPTEFFIVVGKGTGSRFPIEKQGMAARNSQRAMEAVNVGDVVMFDSNFGCVDVEENGRKLKLASIMDMLCVIEPAHAS